MPYTRKDAVKDILDYFNNNRAWPTRRQYEKYSNHSVSHWKRKGWGNYSAVLESAKKQVGATTTNMESDFKEDSATITTKSARITTLEQLLEYAEVDLDIWDVDRHIVNKWEVGAKDVDDNLQVEPLFQVKAWLKRKVKSTLEMAMEHFVSRLELVQPITIPTRKCGPNPHMLEISIFDLHFGKYAWAAETGTDYDTVIAEAIYLRAVDDLIQKTKGFDVEKILFPVGSDFFHVNNLSGTTEKGTRQDVDTRLAHVLEAGFMAVVKAIEIARQIAPVHIVWVPGNHDKLTSMFLCKCLDAYYNQSKAVTVDASPKSRKYCRYGVSLIGFTHGDEEPARDLPVIMAAEEKEAWAQTSHREWHTGHVHKKKQTNYLAADTWGGVVVRVLPSLSGTDAWHFQKGYVKNVRSAEAYLWSKTDGYAGHFSSNYDG